MSMLRRKLARDFVRLRWQVLSIALVVACGVGMFVAAYGTFDALHQARSRFYAATRFPDLFVRLVRAPEAVRDRVSVIEGVAAVESRLSFDVPLELAGVREPVTGRVLSLPRPGQATVGRLLVVTGRLPDPHARQEIAVNDAFAVARGLAIGDEVHAVLEGHRERLTLVGTVLSAEHVSALRGGEVIADDEHFGIVWLPYDALASAFRARGTFNELTIRLAPVARSLAAAAAIDRVLAPYGGQGVYDRSEQPAHRFVDSELRELEVEATVLPVVFLAVAAFLLNIVLARIVAQERTQIATLRALGFTTSPIARHYAALAVATATAGTIIGIAIGIGLGNLMTRTYAAYFHYPDLAFVLDPQLAMLAGAASLVAGLLGVLGSVRRVARLPPAEAMQATAPTAFRAGLLERLRWLRRLPPSLRLVVRNVARRPLRTLAGSIGIAAAMGVLVVGAFWDDSLDALLDHQFRLVQREDAMVTFTAPRRDRAAREIASVPGVRAVEGIRAVPVRIAAGPRSKRVELLGLPDAPRLHRLVTEDGGEVELPRDGLMISRHLADFLAVDRGDRVVLEVLEGDRARCEPVIAGVVDELLGMGAYAHVDTVARIVGEEPTVSGTLVTIEPGTELAVYDALTRKPLVATVTMKRWVIQRFEGSMMQIVVVFALVLTIFGALVVAGVVYNSARVLVGERARDLTTLRVLGFTRADIGEAFLLELGVQVVIGLPLGALAGYGLSAAAVQLFGPEDMSIPLVVGARTWVLAVATVLVAAAVSGWLVTRRLVRTDPLEVLKVRE